MPGKAARRKGSAWERELAKLFRERLGIASIRRGLGQARSGGEVADVDGVPRLWIEAKNRKKVNVRAALEQAANAVAACKSDKLPVAILKEDHRKPVVAMYLEDFMDLLYPRSVDADRAAEAEGDNVDPG